MKVLLVGCMAMAIAVAVGSGGCCTKNAGTEKPGATSMATPMQKEGVCYACPKCEQVALAPGKCSKCGADMAPMHLLGVKDGNAYLCTCGAECKCKMPAEGMKCGCGKDIVKVSLKGKYVCSGNEQCPTISERPGKCACGKDLKLVE